MLKKNKKFLDKLPRNRISWSDGEPYLKVELFNQLICDKCLSSTFHVLGNTSVYETLAQCSCCGKYFVVHTNATLRRKS